MTVDAPTTPPAEARITENLIGGLICKQFPQYAHFPASIIGEGWDNVMARIGDNLAARFPRHSVGEKLLKREQKWLPLLAPRLPLPIPQPLHIGQPDKTYPFTWSIVKWIPGDVAAKYSPDDCEAPTLAKFLKAVHVAAPSDAPRNPTRGDPLSSKRADTERRMLELSEYKHLLTPQLITLWNSALDKEIDVSPTWIAGDVHPQNVLVKDGKFTGFIDWGDMCVGDRAADLASIWMLFESSSARRAVIEAYGMSASTELRAKGWAFFFGVILLQTGLLDDPLHAATGEATLRRLNEDI